MKCPVFHEAFVVAVKYQGCAASVRGCASYEKLSHIECEVSLTVGPDY